MLCAMPSWHPLQPADASFFATAPHVYRFPTEFPVPPEQVWESLASDESVSAWGLGVRSLRWTSERPFGIDTTREVELPLGLITVREKFFRWDEGRGYSFYVTEANRPGLRRFAEDYVVEPGRNGGTRFTWTIALEPTPAMRLPMLVGSPVNRLAFGQLVRGGHTYFAGKTTSPGGAR